MGSVQLSAPTLPFVRSRAAEELQRALDGRLPVEGLNPTIGGYAAVAERLGELVPTTTLRPSPEYRAELHARLVELADGPGGGEPDATRPAVRPDSDRRPRAGALAARAFAGSAPGPDAAGGAPSPRRPAPC